MPKQKARKLAATNATTTDILIAVLGTAPAILTETVWELAREKTPFVPHRIYVLTTRKGRECLTEALFEKGVWTKFVGSLPVPSKLLENRLLFGTASDYIRIVPHPDANGDLDDITSPQHNMAVADTLMRTLREFTEDPETRIVASLAGGRKTMGALLMACMMLLAREQDRLVHVLVNPPFDHPRLDPPFFFPQRGVAHRLPGEKTRYPSSSARIQLCDVPFVRIRGWYEQEYRQPPTSYMTLVQRFQKLAPQATNYPDVKVDFDRAQVAIGEVTIRFSGPEFALFYSILLKHKSGTVIHDWLELSETLSALKKEPNIPRECAWQRNYAQSRFDPGGKEDIRKTAGRVRNKLRESLPQPALADVLVPLLRKVYQRYPAGKIAGLSRKRTSADVPTVAGDSPT
jgi:CRISPR-associated protein (TIGR02584 family)